MSPVRPRRRASRAAGISISVFTAVLAGLITVSPVAASFELGHKGAVGPHSFTDSEAEPGASCSYTTVSDGDVWRGKLSRIDVNPPLAYASSGEQAIGWRFVVRRYRHIEGPGEVNSVSDPFTVIYRSPIQDAIANETTPAHLGPMVVNIIVPRGTLERNWAYLVTVKTFWYPPIGGNPLGSATDRLAWYGIEGSTKFDGSVRTWCLARTAYTSG